MESRLAITGTRGRRSPGAGALVKAERERRRTMREEKMWNLLTSPAVIDAVVPALALAGTWYAGKSRLVNRDLGGFLFGMEAVYAATRHGVKDKVALLGIFEMAAATYAVGVPPKGDEAILELHPSKMFGGDQRLFWWDLPSWMPE